MVALEGFVPEESLDENEVMEAIREQIAGDELVGFDLVTSLIRLIDERPKSQDQAAKLRLREEIIQSCFNRLIEPHKNVDLLSLTFGHARHRIEKYIGPVALKFVRANPTGAHEFDLSSIPAREVLKRLIELYVTQQRFLKSMEPWYSARAGGGRPEIERCWRNAKLNGQPHVFTTAWAVPDRGKYQVDFVQVTKPSFECAPPTQDEMDALKAKVYAQPSTRSKLQTIRAWSGTRVFLCEQVDELLDFFSDEADRVELFVIAFSRTLDWHGYTNLLELLSPVELKELRRRIGVVNLFDDIVAVGYYELEFSDPEERFVGQELVHMAVREPGENIIGCHFNGISLNMPAGWATLLPDKGLLSCYYCRGQETIEKVMAFGAWEEEGHPHSVLDVIPPSQR